MSRRRRNHSKNKGNGLGFFIITYLSGFINDIRCLRKFDQCFYFYQGSWIRNALILHIIIWIALQLSIISLLISSCYKNKQITISLSVFYTFFIISYFILYGIIAFVPNDYISAGNIIYQRISEDFNGYEAIISMKKANTTDLRYVYYDGQNFMYSEANYLRSQYKVYFFTSIIILVLSPIIPIYALC